MAKRSKKKFIESNFSFCEKCYCNIIYSYKFHTSLIKSEMLQLIICEEEDAVLNVTNFWQFFDF